MKKLYVSLLAVAIFAAPMSLYASEPSHFYMGAGWGNYAFNIKNSSTVYGNSSGLALDLGYDFNNILALQTSYIAPDTFTATSGTDEAISYAASLFLRANLRFERSSVYFLVGGSTLGKNNASYDGVGPAYGVGLDFYGGKNVALTIKYINYLDTKTTVGSNKVTLSGTTLGFIYYFDTPRFNNRY